MQFATQLDDRHFQLRQLAFKCAVLYSRLAYDLLAFSRLRGGTISTVLDQSQALIACSNPHFADTIYRVAGPIFVISKLIFGFKAAPWALHRARIGCCQPIQIPQFEKPVAARLP